MVASSNRMLSDVMSVGVFVHPKKKTDKPEKCRATVERNPADTGRQAAWSGCEKLSAG